jgi:hypothetical protein
MKMEKKREIQISNKIDLNRELEKKKKKETYIDSNRNVRCNLKNNKKKKKKKTLGNGRIGFSY